MNKCEIIERLKNIAEYAVHTVGEEPLVMSLDDGIAVHEAIELLENPKIDYSEIPNNSDVISRQAVTKFLNDWLSCLFENCHKQSASDLKMIIKDFKNLPSAQPERKTGRWIPCPQNASWLYVYKCSECGGYLQISDVDGKGYKANYCSYCGAKMEGDEADE